MRTQIEFEVADIEKFKKQLLFWSENFSQIAYLDSNNISQKYSSFDAILAVDSFTSIQSDYYGAFDKLHSYYHTTKDWIFGYLTYDLKNDLEQLSSNNPDLLQFEEIFFFQPKKIFFIKGNRVTATYLNLVSDEMDTDINEIKQVVIPSGIPQTSIELSPRINKKAYFEKFEQIKKYLAQGEIYEVNFCMDFFSENVQINPLHIFDSLNELTQSPFSAFFRNQNHYAMCGSPERYLKKDGKKIISQPIKGTSKRFQNPELDSQSKAQLLSDPKERSENIMIVDLVRNDLSATAAPSSVCVEELCQVYSYKQVHQLISTITSRLKEGISPIEVLKDSFPMGSMTGAPKISAMKIIEKIEESKRGLYSGAIGYFDPNENFDFNVVIRSVLYNSDNQTVSYSVGSAITSKSDAEKEYSECLIKAEAMLKSLNKA
ncbi:MAG: anthranilate synthase component I family protein [Bacteroidota bacterium]|nr:anthranilate synthase component I family protein [Bacteroidota bacterium]